MRTVVGRPPALRISSKRARALGRAACKDAKGSVDRGARVLAVEREGKGRLGVFSDDGEVDGFVAHRAGAVFRQDGLQNSGRRRGAVPTGGGRIEARREQRRDLFRGQALEPGKPICQVALPKREDPDWQPPAFELTSERPGGDAKGLGAGQDLEARAVGAPSEDDPQVGVADGFDRDEVAAVAAMT